MKKMGIICLISFICFSLIDCQKELTTIKPVADTLAITLGDTTKIKSPVDKGKIKTPIDTTRSKLNTGSVIVIDPNGNDASGKGTVESPYRSLYKACSVAKTVGTTIIVNAGTYNETKKCILAPGVNIEGKGDGSLIISTYKGSSYNDFSISLSSNAGDATSAQSISYIKLDGKGLTATNGIIVNTRNNVSIHHCTIVDFKYCGVYFLGSNGKSTGNKFYNNIVNNCSTRKAELANCGLGLLQLGSQKNMLIYNNTFDQTQRTTGENGNCIYGINGHLEDIKIYNNKFHKPNDEGSEWNFHIELFHVEGGFEIYNNQFLGGGQHIDSGQEASKGNYDYSLWIHDNTFEMANQLPTMPHRFSEGIDLELNTTDAIIENNHFRNLGMGIELNIRNSGHVMQNIKIRKNIFENMGYADNSWNTIIMLVGSDVSDHTFQNIFIDNNDIVTGTAGKSTVGIMLQSTGLIKNVYIRNNIFQNIGSYGYLAFWNTAGSIVNVYSQNNILYNNGNNNDAAYNGTIPVTNFVNTNNKKINPLFVSSTDFNFQQGSPGINAGIDVGLPYKQSAPDIGAYESSY